MDPLPVGRISMCSRLVRASSLYAKKGLSLASIWLQSIGADCSPIPHSWAGLTEGRGPDNDQLTSGRWGRLEMSGGEGPFVQICAVSITTPHPPGPPSAREPPAEPCSLQSIFAE